jgi:predicted transcriptional regulator
MAKSVAVPEKRRKPASGPVTIRFSADLRKRVDAWAKQHGAPRSKAIQQLVEMALAAARPVAKLPKKAAAKAGRLAGKAIDRLTDTSAPPAEQAERKRRLLKGPPEFRDMRADLPKAKPR